MSDCRDLLREAMKRLQDAEEGVVMMYEHLLPNDHPGDCYECDKILVYYGGCPWDAARAHNAERAAFQSAVDAALGAR